MQKEGIQLPKRSFYRRAKKTAAHVIEHRHRHLSDCSAPPRATAPSYPWPFQFSIHVEAQTRIRLCVPRRDCHTSRIAIIFFCWISGVNSEQRFPVMKYTDTSFGNYGTMKKHDYVCCMLEDRTPSPCFVWFPHSVKKRMKWDYWWVEVGRSEDAFMYRTVQKCRAGEGEQVPHMWLSCDEFRTRVALEERSSWQTRAIDFRARREVPDIIDRLRLFGEEAVSSMNALGLFFFS